MPLIGVRELRARTAEVLRRVREEKQEYVITHQGEPVALLLPIDEQAVQAAILQAAHGAAGNGWERYSQVAELVRAGWPAGAATQRLLDEVREE
jgi:prevent-host-death family protein